MISRLAIVGTGLIGASVGLGARAAGVGRVVGWDPDPETLALAAERGARSEYRNVPTERRTGRLRRR